MPSSTARPMWIHTLEPCVVGDPPASAPAIIKMVEPEPVAVDTQIAHIPHPRGHWTAVSREFAPEDRGRCRRCPLAECSLNARNKCLVIAPEYLDDESARSYSPLAGRDGGNL